MERNEQIVLEQACRLLNELGREAAEYLESLLKLEDNEEAACWITVTL